MYLTTDGLDKLLNTKAYKNESKVKFDPECFLNFQSVGFDYSSNSPQTRNQIKETRNHGFQRFWFARLSGFGFF